MPIGYEDEFGPVTESAELSPAKRVGTGLAESKWNPYSHPLSYSLRMHTLTRAGAVSSAGLGGLYSKRPLRPFIPLLMGAGSPFGAIGYGALLSASAGPDQNAFSFLTKTALFSSFIGTKGGTKGGGLARAARVFFPNTKYAESIERFASKPTVFRGGLFGKLQHEGLFVPKKQAWARLYEGIGMPSWSKLKSHDLGLGMQDRVKSMFQAGLNRAGKQYPMPKVGLEAKLNWVKDMSARIMPQITQNAWNEIPVLPTKTNISEKVLNITSDSKKIGATLKTYNKQVASDWRNILGNFKWHTKSDYSMQGFYKSLFRAASDASPKITPQMVTGAKRVGGDTMVIKGGKAARRAINLYPDMFEPITKAGTSYYDMSVVKKMMGDTRYLPGLYKSFAGSVEDKMFWDLYGQIGGRTPFIGGLRAEMKFLTRRGRDKVWGKISAEATRLSSQITQQDIVGSALELTGSKEKAARMIKTIQKTKPKGVALSSRIADRATMINISGKQMAPGGMKALGLDRGALETKMFSRLESTSLNSSLSNYFLLAFLGHYAGKAISGSIKAGANLIRKGAEFSSKLTHLEFGGGQVAMTAQASTERTRALQAIQYSGLNARSYLGRESQIYAQ
jgi:hypothetical protein